MKWTFWLDIVSIHLSGLVRALALMPDQSVTVVAEHELSERRKAIGWSTPDCSPAQVLISPSDAEVEQIIGQDRGRESVHIIGGGVKRGSLNRRILSRLAKTRSEVGLMLEAADSRGVLGLARRAKYSLDRFSVEDKLDFIVAMGQVGVQWYKAAGYDSSRIFPFAYVTERPVLAFGSNHERSEADPFQILYLGRIVRRKDGATAIRALKMLSDLDWQFDAVGDGPDLERWKRVAAECGIADKIRFLPSVNNNMIGNLLERADLLLLPSKHDGWGAVVNEALMCGVPVVCSDNCGASDLLRAPWRGSVFTTGSAESLRTALLERIEQGKRTRESSERIRGWSCSLEGPQVARYLVSIIKYLREGGEKPSPPWY